MYSFEMERLVSPVVERPPDLKIDSSFSNKNITSEVQSFPDEYLYQMEQNVVETCFAKI